VQAPAPAPVSAPATAPGETNVVPKRTRDSVRSREHSRHTTRARHTARRAPVLARKVAAHTVAGRVVALRPVPRGGVQAGAGGIAPGLPLAVRAAGPTL
jgi:hypothetical protein